MNRKREQRNHSRSNCDHDRAQPLNPCIDESHFEWLASLMGLFYIVEQHDDVTDNDSDKAGNTKKCHEAKWYVHDPQGSDCANNSEGCCRKYKERLHCVLKLHH